MTHQGLAEHLVEVVTGRHRIDEDQLDLLGGSNDEDISNGLVVGGRPFRGVPVGSGREHTPDPEIGIADHRVVRRGSFVSRM